MTTTTKVLVRRPSPRLADGLVTYLERREIDLPLAEKQWSLYVEALSGVGWDVIEVTPAEDRPDGVFVEDTVVVYGHLAVLGRPAAPSRAGESDAVETVLGELGYSLNRIRPPGTLDGGDVLKVGRDVYVGRGGRTNADGVAQLRGILSPLGARVIPVRVEKALHLKSTVTALPDGTVVGYEPLVDEPSAFSRYRSVPEESGAHVVVVDEGRILVADDCPLSARAFADLGYDVMTVPISEYQKLEGCVTCLSVRLRDVGSSPPAAFYD